jgi:hypothetical protein
MDNNKDSIPENSANLHEGRDEEGKFLPGVSGNPAGKPKGIKHMTTLVKEALKKMAETDDGKKVVIEKALSETIVKLALEGNTKMIQLIWNYLDGMPNQRIELDDTSSEDNRKSLREIADVLNKGKGNSKTDSEILLQK